MRRMATLVVLLFGVLSMSGEIALAQAQNEQGENVFLMRLNAQDLEDLKNGIALKAIIPPNVQFDKVKLVYEPQTSGNPADASNPNGGSNGQFNNGNQLNNGTGNPNTGFQSTGNQNTANPNAASQNNGSQNNGGFGSTQNGGFDNSGGSMTRNDSNQVPIIPRNQNNVQNNAQGTQANNFQPNGTQNAGQFGPRQPTQYPDNSLNGGGQSANMGNANGNNPAGAGQFNPNNGQQNTAPQQNNGQMGGGQFGQQNNNGGQFNSGTGTAPNLFNNQPNTNQPNTGQQNSPLSPRQPSSIQNNNGFQDGDTSYQWPQNRNQQNIAQNEPWQNPNQFGTVQDNRNQQLFDQQSNNNRVNPSVQNFGYDPQDQLASSTNHLTRRQNLTVGHNQPFIPTNLSNTTATENNSVVNKNQESKTPAASIGGSKSETDNKTSGLVGNMPANGRHVQFLYFLLLFSIGLNFYLGWISRSFYVRYRELADELRETFSSSI